MTQMQNRTDASWGKLENEVIDSFNIGDKAKAISVELLELNLKNKLEETGKTR